MSLPRFFLETQVIASEPEGSFDLALTPDDLHHANVLRLKPGEHIAVVDADTDYFECEVVAIDKSRMHVRIASRGERRRALSKVTLFQGIPKGDKMDAVVRQCTEIGATAFVPLECSRSVVRLDAKKAQKRQERWATIACSAAMQAGREAVPEVLPPAPFASALEMLREFDAVCVFWEEAHPEQTIEQALSGEYGPMSRIALVIGPEGGFSPEEAAALSASNPVARMATLGDNILRTETAAVVGCALAIHALGGLGADANTSAEPDGAQLASPAPRS